MKLSSKEAYELLIQDVIFEEADFLKEKNRWVQHCINVGIAAGRIAKKLGLNDDFAQACGYLHDVGRKISHPRHVIEGYYYLQNRGYEEMARFCITHSFINNDINLTAGGPLRADTAALVSSYLNIHSANIYDHIIQLCDLFCLDTGFTTIEKRILDISLRKGVYDNSLNHFYYALHLKSSIERQMGCSLYSLFPEIPNEYILSISDDRNQLEALLSQPFTKKE